MTDNTTTNNNEISKETSARICTHMNEDHAVSVYAMAKSLLPASKQKISNAKLKNVTLEGCQISVVTCQGDLCEVHNVFYKFHPPLADAGQVRSAMVNIHHQVCAPQVSWLVTHVDALVVLLIVVLLGYATHMIGTERLTEILQQNTLLGGTRLLSVGGAKYLSAAVKYSWYFAILAHGAEALYVVYQARTTLKMRASGAALWFLMVGSVGWPITKEFLELLRVHNKSKISTTKKES